ncbi:M66 family metalloprotease [Pseudomonas syringae]|uniref:M66 family metalloprotease n=1 Tax=Pseudomonas syringae TaxID=317 RepID=UPI00073EB086|nr:M66 family metalloprotease [Pseudomonas syringae]NAT17239.1 ToxR-regulated lipoprotein [Pseudomonas syringae pv. actinidifoliorum]NAT60932.1 ToxR-regulated lipoprotein [Pseudomonas syringae pv. actinidifoliorum]
MNDEIVFTLVSGEFQARPYAGLTTQSFDIVGQGDGSVGIRNQYSDVVVSMTTTRVWASTYAGNQSQSFDIRKYPDGSCTIHSKYYPVVIEMTDSGVTPKAFVDGDLAQRFYLVCQGDGSTGIRKVSRVFNTRKRPNDLQGPLVASVQFAQSQIFSARPTAGGSQPYLTARRKALLMVKPAGNINALSVTVYDSGGVVLGSLILNKPYQLPKTVYHVASIKSDTAFDLLSGPAYTLKNPNEISRLSDHSGAFLLEKLQQHEWIDIETEDGSRVDEIYLPLCSALNGRIVRVHSTADGPLTVFFDGRELSVQKGETYQFKCVSGSWVSDVEWGNRTLVYAEKTWSAVIPAHWIKPGITLHFDSGQVSGDLKSLQVGGATELLINTIDIGMLIEPRNAYTFAVTPGYHRQYFQTIPVTRLVVNNYESLYLSQVMLPDGTLLTDFDPSEGGWHIGTMRQRIGKELISLGINHANYGINCFEGEADWTPYVVAQLTAHNNRGKYANGIQVHGGSGGGGIVTLDSSISTEFSHELGHNFGLGHYPGGFDGSVHQDADGVNSTWGWDMDLRLFLPNFRPEISHVETCLEGRCQSPFFGRSFGTDPMASGSPMSSLNKFVLHTPYTAAITQTFLESKPVFAQDSSTGFRKWDPDTQSMEPYAHRVDVMRPVLASNADLTEGAISALLNKSRLVKVWMWENNWVPSIHIPPASSFNAHCIIITVESNTRGRSQLYINGRVISVMPGFAKSYISSGSSWNECIVLDGEMSRVTAPNSELSRPALTAFLNKHRVVRVAMWDGNWASSIDVPPASPANNRRVIVIDQQATYATRLDINGLIIPVPTGAMMYFLSDGSQWNDYAHLIDTSIERSPKAFGVPVTTLVGYYDPQTALPSYVYPALHGAYGFIYADDSATLIDTDCQLWVTSSGQEPLRFKLDNNRIRSSVMNAFHINVAESSGGRTVKIICNGKTVAERFILPAKVPLTYTVNGE